jgi:predicted DNA-binding protein
MIHKETTMSKEARSPHARVRVRVHARLSTPLRDRLAGYCQASGNTERNVIETAIHHYLNATSDATLVLKQLHRLGRAEARLQRDMELLSEAFAIFVQLWFAHTPSVPAQVKVDARATANSRYKQYVQYIVRQFSGGQRFLDDLPRELVADERELHMVAAGKQP